MKKIFALTSTVVMITTIIPVQANETLFSDSFEWGLSDWLLLGTDGSTVVTTTEQAKEGVHALKAQTYGLEPYEMAYAQKELSGTLGEAYVRAYFFFPSLPNTTTYWTPFCIRYQANQPGAYAYIELHTTSWILFWRDSSMLSQESAIITSPAPEKNKWTCIEFHVKVGTSGIVELWIDGTKVYSVTVNNSEWTGINCLQVGERWSNESQPHAIYTDSVTMSDSYIGPIGPSPPEQSIIQLSSNHCQGDLYLPNGTLFHLRQDQSFYWFGFSASDVTGKSVTFTIDLSEYSGWGWFKVKQPVYSYSNSFLGNDWTRISNVVDTVSLNKKFTFTEAFTNKTVWIAPTFPFPYTQCYNWIAAIDEASPYVRSAVVGRSYQGRDMIVTTITDWTNPVSVKKVVWFIAGQHPSETSGQIALKTMSDWLISEDPAADFCRRNYEFHIVYEMNPDGNYHGRFRTDALGRNLNRAWDDLEKPSEVSSIYDVVKTTYANSGKVDLFIDWHCDGTDFNFQYAIADTIGIPKELRDENVRLTKCIQQYATGPTQVIWDGKGEQGLSHDQMAFDFGINGVCIEQGLDKIDSLTSIRQFGLNMLNAINYYFWGNITSVPFIEAESLETPIIPTFPIQASESSGDSIYPSGNIVTTSGSNQTFSVMPDTDYRIVNVLTDGNPASPTQTFYNTTADGQSISAAFELEIIPELPSGSLMALMVIPLLIGVLFIKKKSLKSQN